MSITIFLKNLLLLALLVAVSPYVINALKGYRLPTTDMGSKVAIVSIKGQLADSTCYAEQLHHYFKADDIKAILLKIDSPGGAQGTGEALFGEIDLLKREHKKPVIVFVENLCTSAAYLIASAADYIVSSPSALVGGIGTTLPWLFHVNDFLKEHNIGYTPIKAGEYKMAGCAFTAMTLEEQGHLQAIVDDAYDQFVRMVAMQRHLSPDTRDAWANGRLFTGVRAKQAGLIDAVGSLQKVARVIKEKALIDGEIEWVKESCATIWQRLFGDPSGRWGVSHSLSTLLHSCLEHSHATLG